MKVNLKCLSKTIPSLCSLCSLILLPFTCLAGTEGSPILAFPSLSIDTIDKEVSWFPDHSGQLPYDAILKENFQSFDFSEGIPFNPYHVFWFKFALKNQSNKDTLDMLLCTGDYSKIRLHTNSKPTKIQKGGDFLSVHNRAYRLNDLCIPIKINPLGIQNYLLSIYHFKKNKRESFPLVLKSYKQEGIARKIQYAERVPNYIFFGIFSGTIFILFFYAAFQYKATFDKAFLFYAIYLVSIYIYNLKNYESDPGWAYPLFFSYFMELKKVLEVTLEHLGYIFYILFIQHFLNLAKESPKINKYLTISIWFLLGYILIDYLLQATVGIRNSITIHHYVRALFFIPAFFLIYHIFFQQKNKLYQYIFVGSIILLLSSFYTLIGQLFPVEKQMYFGDIIKGYNLWGYQMYMYQMKVGLLLEMICFAFGLSYKNSQQWKNYLALNEKIIRQNLQIQKITYTPTENQSPADVLMQQINLVLEEEYKNTNFGTQELANLLLMSRSKLSRQLKKKGQVSPSSIIRKFRLEKARNLILTTDLNLSEIAHQSGFNEAGYFSKVFKDLYKISPSDLRLRQ